MDYVKNITPCMPFAMKDLIAVRENCVVSMALSKLENCPVTLLAFGEKEGVSQEQYFGDTLYIVVEGIMHMMLEDGERDVKEGELVVIPSQTLHAIGYAGSFKVLQITLSE